MRAHCIPGLVVVTTEDACAAAVYSRAASLDHFQHTVPDTHGLLCHLGKLVHATTLPDLCMKLGFKGPMEDLSVWLCLASWHRVTSNLGRTLLRHPLAPALACALAKHVLRACSCLRTGD